MNIRITYNLLIPLILLSFVSNSVSSQAPIHTPEMHPENKLTKPFLSNSHEKIGFDMRLQTDAALFMGDTYNPISNGVGIRRARLGINTEFNEKWYGEIQVDVANSQLKLKDAYLQFSPNQRWRLLAGNFKEGFSIESVTSSRNLTFAERANVISAFAPSRHMGMALHYHKSLVLAMAGIHFQDVGGIKEFTASNYNRELGNDEGISLTGRAVVMPVFNQQNSGLHFGLAGSYRTPKTDAGIAGSKRYSSRSLSAINPKKYMDTDTISQVDYVMLSGIELAAYHRNLRVQSEFIFSNVYREHALPTEQMSGWYVFGSILLFGGTNKYKPEQGCFSQPVQGKKWGDIELAWRYDYLSLNSKGNGIIRGGESKGYTLGINYYVNNNVRIMLNYAYLTHDRYANGAGSFYVGLNREGEPTKNPAEVESKLGNAGEDYSMVSLRFEINL